MPPLSTSLTFQRIAPGNFFYRHGIGTGVGYGLGKVSRPFLMASTTVDNALLTVFRRHVAASSNLAFLPSKPDWPTPPQMDPNILERFPAVHASYREAEDLACWVAHPGHDHHVPRVRLPTTREWWLAALGPRIDVGQFLKDKGDELKARFSGTDPVAIVLQTGILEFLHTGNPGEEVACFRMEDGRPVSELKTIDTMIKSGIAVYAQRHPALTEAVLLGGPHLNRVSHVSPVPVDTSPPNINGLHKMFGNVAEWTSTFALMDRTIDAIRQELVDKRLQALPGAETGSRSWWADKIKKLDQLLAQDAQHTPKPVDGTDRLAHRWPISLGEILLMDPRLPKPICGSAWTHDPALVLYAGLYNLYPAESSHGWVGMRLAADPDDIISVSK